MTMTPVKTRVRGGGFAIGLGEASRAVADLGVLVPLAAALILVNHLDPGAVLLGAGLLAIGSGLFFRVPFPVQPLKALTAVAVAEQLAPGVIHAAGLEIAAFLVLLSVKGVADWLARLFTKPVVRALQLGVGVLLIRTAIDLATDPPSVFAGTPQSPWPFVLAVLAFAGIVVAARRRWYGLALGILGIGIVAVAATAHPHVGGPRFHLPGIDLPPARAFATAFLLLVVPQLPLTFGNAVGAVSDLAHEYFGDRASRVRPTLVCVSCATGNVAAALLGGMPMCHGAGGLTAHYRLGARTAGMNLLLGGVFVVLGLFFAPQVPVILGLFPVWALAAFLAYAGLRHAMLIRELRGFDLAVAVNAGLIGAWQKDLAITAGLALAAVHGARLLSRTLATR